ncbi:hypothetical protein SBV1_620042 [Verrucomicrobia bacterium]|nr:hypothetical protein SBV1_620042 [Verrucomicrobiota bacterium]
MKKLPFAQAAASRFRRHWLLAPGTVFLNHGSFGACPKAILERQAALRLEMEAEPVQFLWRRYEERLEPARAALARFIGARPRDVVFVTNATVGVNAVVRSLRLRRGDELLTTNHDYNACHNVLLAAAREARAKVVLAQVPFPLRTEEEVVEAVMRAVTRRTRLALIDHVTSNTALVFPVSRLCFPCPGSSANWSRGGWTRWWTARTRRACCPSIWAHCGRPLTPATFINGSAHRKAPPSFGFARTSKPSCSPPSSATATTPPGLGSVLSRIGSIGPAHSIRRPGSVSVGRSTLWESFCRADG